MRYAEIRESLFDLWQRLLRIEWSAEDWRDQTDLVWEDWLSYWGFDNEFLTYDWGNENHNTAENLVFTHNPMTSVQVAMENFAMAALPIFEEIAESINEIAASMAIPAHLFDVVEPSSRSEHPRRHR